MKKNLALDGQLTTECGINAKQKRLIANYCITPYISGTFHGFEEEFKHLYTKVFPKLDALCREKGCRFFPACHRRTAVESRSSSDLILTHALDSIKECSPFFMAIFGQQYGVHRSHNEPLLSGRAEFGRHTLNTSTFVDRNLLNAGKHQHWWVLDKKWQYCSFMELEIQVAALEESSIAKHCYFYIRDFKHSYLKQNLENIYSIAGYREHGDSVSKDGCSLFEAENRDAEKRLNDLKMRIVKKGWSIKYFRSPTELGEAVLQNWTKLINLLYPSPYFQNEFSDSNRCNDVSRCEHETTYHFSDDLQSIIQILDTHVMKCMPSDTSVDDGEIGENITSIPEDEFDISPTGKRYVLPSQWENCTQGSEKNILVVVGDPGCGKTSLIAKWLRHFEEEHPDILVISEFIGSCHVSRDIGSFLRRCVKTIRELSGNRMTSSELLEDTKSYSSLVSAFHMCISRVPCVLVIDSLNDLKPSMGEDIGSIKKITWLPSVVPSNCRIILTSRRSDLTYKALAMRKDVSICWVPILSKSDRISLLKTRLTHHLLSIGTANADNLTGNRLSEKPLFLVTIAGLVSSCSSQREVDRVVEKCTELRTFREFWKTTFTLWTLRFSWRKNSQGMPGTCRTLKSGWVSDSLRVIAASRNGLLASEILHILFLIGYKGKSIVTPYDWAIFQKAAKDAFLVQPEGYITLAHTEIRHAVKYYLLGMALPTAMAAAASLGGVNMQQQFHSLLSNYFVNYGSMERKVVELPWQLEQGGDMVLLCQVMSKARFFESFCEATQNHPYLMIDLLHFWNKLNDAGFSPSHYLQTMVERVSEKTKSIFSLDYSWNPNSLGIGSLKTISTVSSSSLKRPSLALTSTFEDMRRQSTVGTRSECGDFDLMSEAGSSSFFVTESEPKPDVAGWSPRLENPECAINESQLDDDESCQLSYKVCIFLHQLGGGFVRDAKDNLLALSQLLLEMRPLTSKQQEVEAKTLSALAKFSVDEKNSEFVRCLCEESLEVFESLSAQLPPRAFELKGINEGKILVCRLLAQICTENAEYERSDKLLHESVQALKVFRSKTEKLHIEFAKAKLYVAQGLYGKAESNLKEILTSYLHWYGPTHISVGNVLHQMADLYAILESEESSEQRISLLAYKQAFKIYQQNADKGKEATLLHKIGTQLKKDSSLFSTQEARLCLENAVDLYTTQIGATHADIPSMREDVRKLSVDLLKGRFEFGRSKPVDNRTEEFAYSTLSWHDQELRKISKRRSLHSAPSSYGKASEPLMGRSLKSHTSPRPMSQGTVQAEHLSVKDSQQSIVKLEVVAPTSQRLDGEESIIFEEGKDTVIIPAGRESRLSVKLQVKEGSEKSFSARAPTSKRGLKTPLLEERSEISEYTDTTFPRRYTPRVRYLAHRKSCAPPSGPDDLCMTVHGAHSTIQSLLLDRPQSARLATRDSGIWHKSAWYNVPGRYRILGQILPPKHNQVRSEGPTRTSFSRRSCRSFHSV